MITMKPSELLENVTTRATVALASFLESSFRHNIDIETLRIVRALYILACCGCATRLSIFSRAIDHVVRRQKADGGWSDPEETAWAIGAIRLMWDIVNPGIPSAIQWLNSVRHPGGGWGRHIRDQARIPVTALISILVPEVVRHEDKEWLAEEWMKDFNSQVRLSYKAGFFLLTKVETQKKKLITQTIYHLYEDQNEDGGFGPWKDHPIGSEPWSTGIVLLGLLSYPELVKREIIEKAVNWLAENQLSNGLWPYHYIEEGSAYAYWGLVEALKYLSKESN